MKIRVYSSGKIIKETKKGTFEREYNIVYSYERIQKISHHICLGLMKGVKDFAKKSTGFKGKVKYVINNILVFDEKD